MVYISENKQIFLSDDGTQRSPREHKQFAYFSSLLFMQSDSVSFTFIINELLKNDECVYNCLNMKWNSVSWRVYYSFFCSPVTLCWFSCFFLSFSYFICLSFLYLYSLLFLTLICTVTMYHLPLSLYHYFISLTSSHKCNRQQIPTFDLCSDLWVTLRT